MYSALAALGLAVFATDVDDGASRRTERPWSDPAFVLVEHRAAALTDPGRGGKPAFGASRIGPLAGLSSRSRHLGLVRAAEAAHSLPRGLLDALIATESAYRPRALSRAGAAGLAQLMPGTATELGVSNRFDPWQSIEGGARYLRRMLDRFGSITLALAAYNAGPGAVARAGGIPANGETPAYVRRVLRRWAALPRD